MMIRRSRRKKKRLGKQQEKEKQFPEETMHLVFEKKWKMTRRKRKKRKS